MPPNSTCGVQAEACATKHLSPVPPPWDSHRVI